MVSSDPTAQGQPGLELCIHKHFWPSSDNVFILWVYPRRLLVRLKLVGFQAYCLVAHAPHQSNIDILEEWCHLPFKRFCAFIDANARLGRKGACVYRSCLPLRQTTTERRLPLRRLATATMHTSCADKQLSGKRAPPPNY